MILDDGRRLCIWCGPSSINQLASVIAEAAALELFNLNGALTRLHNKQLIPITLDIMRGIVGRYVASVRLVGTAGGWEPEIYSFEFGNTPNADKEPSQKTLLALMDLLPNLVARAPREPSVLTDHQQREVRDRLKMGEPPANIASYYGVDIDSVKQMRR